MGIFSFPAIEVLHLHDENEVCKNYFEKKIILAIFRISFKNVLLPP